MSGKQALPFHGILAVGNTKDEAVTRYRLLAQGKGVTAMVDEGQQVAFVTHASNKIAEMFNPKTGELDLQKDESVLSKLNFEAKASGEVVANHYVCSAGCGLHVVYDSEDLMHHCPSCTTAVTAGDDDEEEDEEESEDEDEESEDDEDDSEDEEDEDEESESSDDDEDDEEDDSEDDEESDEEEDDSEEDEEGDDEESEEDDSEEEDEEADDAEDDDDEGEPLVIAADSKEKAIDIYRANRQGIATAATSVEVDYMVCSSDECNAHVLSEDPSVKDCPACASPLKQPEEAQAGDENAAPTSETPAAPATETAPAASQSSDDEEDEEGEDESDMNVVDEDEDDEAEEEDESESSGGQIPKEPAMSETAEKITVNMLSQIDDTVEKAHQGLDLSFSASINGNPLWTAFYNGLPVATASKADAGKNADIFADPAFGNAVIAGAKHIGVKSTLTEMGFKGIAHEISISSVVSDRVKSEVTAANEELARDRKEHAERLMAALATAAIGINRGFFPDIKNPVKAALWNALSSAGVKNAEVLIDNAFKSGGDAYHTSLFAKAAELVGKPLEVQESLSKAVLGSNYMGVSESSANGSNLENRLENFGTVTASATAAPAVKPEQKEAPETSVSSDAHVSSVVAGLGRRR